MKNEKIEVTQAHLSIGSSIQFLNTTIQGLMVLCMYIKSGVLKISLIVIHCTPKKNRLDNGP